MAKTNSKLLHLIAELGDPQEYTNTGWYYRKFMRGVPINPLWNNKWTWVPEDCPRERLPKATNVCPCTTPIEVHYLVKHKKTGSLHFVGSECIKRFEAHYKLCTRCKERWTGKTPMCKDCRILRFDNSDSEYKTESNISRSTMEEKIIDPLVLTFGKYRGSNIDQINDDGYIQFILKSDLINGKLFDHVVENILPNTKCQFGKYKYKPLKDITDKQYIRWVIAKTDHSYFKYL